MKIYIKNMVCSRCKMVVKSVFDKIEIHPLDIELGEIELEMPPSKQQLSDLKISLKQYGFELIDDKKSRLIERIKTIIVKKVHYSENEPLENLSRFISGQLNHDYGYLSNLFSEVEGTTIEKYYISQKIERVKELLVYDELSVSEIAEKLNYSSVAYLSAQFKKITGNTPSYYRGLKEHKRKNIEDL